MMQPEPEDQPTETEVVIGDVDTEQLKQALTEEKEKSENYLTNWQRAQADFVNYKRRNEKEKEEIGQLAKASVMLNLLSALDDFERAFASVPPNLANLSWMDGIRLIERKLQANLEAQGLSYIETVGEPFDPKLHEAAMYGKGKQGIVTEELQKGYRLYDRVLRPAMVVVGEGEAEEPEENEVANNTGEN